MTATESPLNILLIDDHALFREGLVRLLEREPGFNVSGQAGSVSSGLDVLSKSRADVVLLDFDLGADRAVNFVVKARTGGFSGKILVVTAGISDQHAVELIEAGISGIFHKHNPPEALCDCIRQVAGGEVWLEKNYLKSLFERVDSSQPETSVRLTEREREVLRSVFQGLASKEIADRLQVTETAVKGTLQQLFRKTGVRTRSQLVRVALEQLRDQL